MITERRTNISTWWSPSLNMQVIRADHWGPNGASTNACASYEEARLFFIHCDNRKPKRNDKNAEV